MKNNKKQKGFTLIELLVVIAIIAILAVVVVLTLNPAQLLAQARDSNRISDFATLKTTLSLYATDVSTSTPMYGATGMTGNGAYDLYTAATIVTSSITWYQGTTSTPGWGFEGGETNITSTNSRTVGGSGWIPVNLNAISAGAPISSWPVDPVNSGNLMYIYAASSSVFKLASHMESTKYSTGGSNDVESTDGGTSNYSYQQGTNLSGL